MRLMLLHALLVPLALALAPPEASVARGFHEAPFTVELSAPAGATVLHGLGALNGSGARGKPDRLPFRRARERRLR